MTTGVRQHETMCPDCGRLVGVRIHQYNRQSPRVPRLARHHERDAARWCRAGGRPVPANMVIPVDAKVS